MFDPDHASIIPEELGAFAKWIGAWHWGGGHVGLSADETPAAHKTLIVQSTIEFWRTLSQIIRSVEMFLQPG